MTPTTVATTDPPLHAVPKGHPASLDGLLQLQRAADARDGTPDLATRIDRLDRFAAWVADSADELVDAIAADFGSRSRQLAWFGDLTAVLAEAAEQRRHLKRWMADGHPNRLAGLFALRMSVRHEPLGVVGIAGPWNFPVQLTLVPAAAAIAAGNRVMVRPSSATPRTTETLARNVGRYLDPEELSVITADFGPGAAFSKLRFDAFFFTGSPAVGREVAADCAANLVPVTLELGGKNPAIVDIDADLSKAAARIAASKLVNSGQVCLCPDYVCVPEDRLDAFVEEVLGTWRTAFPTIVSNPEYTSIINKSNYDRIRGLIDDAREKGATVRQVILPGEDLPDGTTRKIAPTVLTELRDGMTVEHEEIFGPVLAVYPYRELGEALSRIVAGEHPLTMYWYGPMNDRYRRALDATRSGSVNGNDFLLNMLPGLPFGGVGHSGMGAYHGRYGFETFTHRRAVAHSSLPVSLARLLAPPSSRALISALRARMAINRHRNTVPRGGTQR